MNGWLTVWRASDLAWLRLSRKVDWRFCCNLYVVISKASLLFTVDYYYFANYKSILILVIECLNY